jgi:hypothetical protein
MGQVPDGSDELAILYATFTEGFDENPLDHGETDARRLSTRIFEHPRGLKSSASAAVE